MNSLNLAEPKSPHLLSNFAPDVRREEDVDAYIRSEAPRVHPVPVGEGTMLVHRHPTDSSPVHGIMQRGRQFLAQNTALALGASLLLGALAGGVFRHFVLNRGSRRR